MPAQDVYEVRSEVVENNEALHITACLHTPSTTPSISPEAAKGAILICPKQGTFYCFVLVALRKLIVTTLL